MRIRGSLLIAAPAAIVLGLGLPQGAEAAGQKSGQQSATGQSSPQASQSERMMVTDAESLIGTTLKDKSGKDVGQIKYLMIDPTDGDVVLTLVGAGITSDPEDRFYAIPWDSIDVSGWQQGQSGSSITVKAERSAIDNAIRYGVKDLFRLTSPVAQTENFSLWAPMGASASASTQQNPQQQAGSAQSAQKQPMQSGAQGQAGSEQQAKSGTKAQAGSQQGQAASQGQSGSQGQAHLLVGRGFTTNLQEPVLTLDNQMTGSKVFTMSGDQVGEIENIVIDVDTGKVAYALVSRGTYLGMGGEWVPIPVQALQWSAQERYEMSQEASDALKGDKSQFQPSAALPARISRDDLADLYQRFGVDPYWQQS